MGCVSHITVMKLWRTVDCDMLLTFRHKFKIKAFSHLDFFTYEMVMKSETDPDYIC